jgi:hypothetical protein
LADLSLFSPVMSMLLFHNIAATFGGMHLVWLAAGAGALVVVTAVCAFAFGSCLRTVVLDLLLIALAELAVAVVLSSPLDLFHLQGGVRSQWSIALGTLLATVGIVLNHRAEEG